jgi:LPPG:FO 2-phospho-L-lactate transferase
VRAALGSADRVIIGPSNPLISVAPILTLVRDALPARRTVAVTPIVAGAALKGPTVEMMRALGPEPNPVEVARLYEGVAATFVLDERDRDMTGEISALGYRVLVADTVMRDGGRALAQVVLGA